MKVRELFEEHQIVKDVKPLVDYALERGWKLIGNGPNGSSLQRYGKGIIWFGMIGDTYAFSKSSSYGYTTVVNGTVEHILDVMKTGMAKKYFTPAKSDDEIQKRLADRKKEQTSDVDDSKYTEDENYKDLASRYEVTKFKTGKLEFQMSPEYKMIVYDNGYVRLEAKGSDRLRVLRQPPKQGSLVKMIDDSDDSPEAKTAAEKLEKRQGLNKFKELFKALDFANSWSKKWRKGEFAKGTK